MSDADQNNSKISTFKDLVVWQEGHKLVLQTYIVTKRFPKEEIYSLTSQMRRCAVSITSNIAEGFGRQHSKEKTQFYYHSRGSIVELQNQLEIAKDLGYMDNENFCILETQLIRVHKILNGLIKKTKDL